MISLRKSADPERGQERTLEHIDSVKFASDPPIDLQGSIAQKSIEVEPVDPSHSGIQTRKPRGSIEEIELGDVRGNSTDIYWMSGDVLFICPASEIYTHQQ